MKKRGGEHELALKFDMNKAYDWVEWDFFKKTIRRMGFEEFGFF